MCAAAVTAYFIGAGPGDPGLLTLRGAEVLARSDVVLHDANVHAEVLARGPSARLVVGDGAAGGLRRAEEIGARIVSLAREGKTVGRLSAGDPFLFASGDEEVAHVARAGVAFEVVPGIVGALAAGAYAGLTLSRGADASPSVAIADTRPGVTLHDWTKLAAATDTLALMTDQAGLDELARTLVFYGRRPDTPAAVVTDVSLPSQRVVTGTLEDIARKAAGLRASPLRLFVGEVAARRDPLRWFDRRPLFGKRVLVTRSREQAQSTASLLRERGAEPIVVPTIELHAPSDRDAVASAILRLASYDWVAFTSANGVTRTWGAIEEAGRDARAFGAAKIAAIGPATAEALAQHGLRADVMAKEFKGEGLASEMLRVMAARSPATRVLILRAQEARDALPDALRSAGFAVDAIAVYQTVRPAAAAANIAGPLERGELDAVTFSSGSTVDNLCDLLGEAAPALLAKVRVASIGPITTATCDKRGVRVDVTAREYTLPALVAALESLFI